MRKGRMVLSDDITAAGRNRGHQTIGCCPTRQYATTPNTADVGRVRLASAPSDSPPLRLEELLAITVKARWPTQTEEDRETRRGEYLRISERAGSLGHLCEAYHGAPYVLMYFLREGFDEDPQSILDRVSTALGPALPALRDMGFNVDDPQISFDGYQTDFGPDGRVERMLIYSEEDDRDVLHCVYPSEVLRERLPIAFTLANLKGERTYDQADGWPQMVNALTAFVELVERLEREGEGPVLIEVSY